MRLATLYLRSRLTGRALACLAAMAALTWYWLGSIDPWELGSLPVLLTVTPLAFAVILGVSARSPFGDTERTASYSLPLLRLGHLGGLLVASVLGLLLASVSWPLPDGEWSLFRNLAGFTGLALLGARLIGSALSWVVPLGYAGLVLMIGGASRWAWPVKLPVERWSASIAIALLVVGLAVIAFDGARESPGETS